MASVFLSYDRDDAARASSIASALEKAGHSVWWDRHIKSGSQYSKEIEKALNRAEAVVVLWSERSVDSAWVRDEAAAGRDSGRLVPVKLDSTSPPMGFRQYQTIDFSRRTGRHRGRAMAELLRAIGTFGKTDIGAPPVPHSLAILAHRSSPMLLVGLAVAAIATLAALLWQPWRIRHSVPLVAVAPAEASAAADALAADLLIKLGVLQSSHADALQLLERDSDQAPDFIFKVGGADVVRDPHASLALFESRAGTLLWSREFVQPGGKQADLRQQIAYSAAQVLNCATEALSTKQQRIELPTLKLYLGGCADLSNLLAQNPQVIIPTFIKVTNQAPKFQGGWKKLLLAEVQAFNLTWRSDQGLRQDLKNHVAQARRVDPSMAEAFLAEGALQGPGPTSGWVKFADLAVAQNPDNPEVLANQALALANVGLMREALAATRRAVEFNPLSPNARDALVVDLLNNGQVEAARKELEESERLWPGATNVLQSRFVFEFRAGDPAKALRMLQSGELGPRYSPKTARESATHESFLKARVEPSSASKELAVANALALYRQDPSASWVYIRTLAEFERHEEAMDALLRIDPRVSYYVTWVLFRPNFAALHRDRRFMVIAHRFGVMDYWRQTGKWADFCSRPDLTYDCKAEAAKLAA